MQIYKQNISNTGRTKLLYIEPYLFFDMLNRVLKIH